MTSFRSPRHHSMLHDIVHKEKAARGAIEDFQQKKSMPRPCEFLWPQNPTDYLWKLKNTLSKLSEQVFGYGECSHLGVRSYWLRRKWSEVNIIRLSKSERYTQIFQQPAYRQLLYLCFLNSWWRIPQVSQVSIYLCFATIIIIIFLWVSRRNQLHLRLLRSTLFRRHWAYLTAWYGRSPREPMSKASWWVTGTAWLAGWKWHAIHAYPCHPCPPIASIFRR